MSQERFIAQGSVRKEHPSEAVLMFLSQYEKSKHECKDKNVCQNAWENVTAKLEFIKNR